MPSVYHLRQQFEALKRRYARVIAAAHMLPVAQEIADDWNDAAANDQPKPDPATCVRKVAKAGFRLFTFKALHIYLGECRLYVRPADPWEIIRALLPPKSPVVLSKVLPDIY